LKTPRPSPQDPFVLAIKFAYIANPGALVADARLFLKKYGNSNCDAQKIGTWFENYRNRLRKALIKTAFETIKTTNHLENHLQDQTNLVDRFKEVFLNDLKSQAIRDFLVGQDDKLRIF